MTKHTPGPWTWGENYTGLCGSGKDNEILCYAGYDRMWVYEKNATANTALISAAPDLLEALQDLVSRISGGANLCAQGFDSVCATDKARAAIAKATQ